MKLTKLLLAGAAAAVLLGAFVSSASARNFSISEQRQQALWRTVRFTGGFGEIACEILLSGSLHSRTTTKTVNLLVGYITEGTILRCASGGATINQASFPWHRRYRGFSGTLPNITGASETIVGAEWRVREPTFGITCTVRKEESGSLIATSSLTSGVITSIEVRGEGSRCEGIAGSLSSTETNVVNNLSNRTRITVTLI